MTKMKKIIENFRKRISEDDVGAPIYTLPSTPSEQLGTLYDALRAFSEDHLKTDEAWEEMTSIMSNLEDVIETLGD